MTPWEVVAVLAAGLAAGGVNAIVGAGTLVTFSTLVTIGIPPLTANVSNTVGLAAGSFSSSVGYRRELNEQRSRAIRLAPASILGGVTGAALLMVLPSSTFDAVVPVLILLGVVLVVVQPRLAKRLETPHEVVGHGGPLVLLGVFVTGIYGGYFGAAQGVLLIALLAITVDQNLQRVNAMKNLLATLVNLVAAIFFIFAADIDWLVAALIMGSSIVGGWLGAHYGRHLSQTLLRWFIVVIGLVAVTVMVTQ
jgi:uncharacterized membrane protein YfcA